MKKSKKQKTIKETTENVDSTNAPTEESIQQFQDAAPNTVESPIYIPTLSSPEPETPDSTWAYISICLY